MFKRRRFVSLLPVAGLCVSAPAADRQTISPTEDLSDETPSLEAAFPDQMFISRTQEAPRSAIDYEVRVYSEKPGDQEFATLSWEVAIEIRDAKGGVLFSAELEAGGIATMPPNKNEFRVFRFSVHESLEKTAAINIGRHAGLRMRFTRYRLPLKSVDHAKAH